MECRLRRTLVLWIVIFGVRYAEAVRADGLVAQYQFDEGSGAVVKDSSGNGLDGVTVGSVKWVTGVRGSAMSFDGLTRVSVPASRVLDLSGKLSITSWLKGRASGFRMVREPASDTGLRGAYFQVCGETLYFASYADHPTGFWDKKSAESDEVRLFTGSADISLDHWRDQQRTRLPFSGDEPKLQVVGNSVYYEFMGQDANGVWQIWTASSNLDGSNYLAVQRTHEHEKGEYRVEQGALQVVGNEIFYFWPQKDEHGIWQTWTAFAKRDGTGFTPVQVTRDGSVFVYAQIVHGRVYYLLGDSWRHRGADERTYVGSFSIGVSDRRGRRFRVLKRMDVASVGTGGGAFQVANGKIFLAYIQTDRQGYVRLYTGHMNVDGTDFRVVERKLGDGIEGIPGVAQLGVTVVGHKVYYAIELVATRRTASEAAKELFQKATIGKEGLTFWVAQSDINDSGWSAVQGTRAPPDIMSRYKGVTAIGGKLYHSLTEYAPYSEPWVPFHPYFATSGSNIVNKGDSYGLGLTRWNEARAFVNAGEDYLFRGEAPEDISGAIADSAVDENWHFLTTTYDERTLKLYVDGELKASVPYHAHPGRNPFPLTIGDGFIGTIAGVSIYNRTLTGPEIRMMSRRPAN
jgi:Concanavalin A-like lectin/glucanases superfamily